MRKITEEGVRFQSHIDGHAEFLSPNAPWKSSVCWVPTSRWCWDECPALPAEKPVIEKSLALSMRWAKRSKAAFGEQTDAERMGRACFGIVQGGTFAGLRMRSAQALCEIGFDGYAVGGLAVGEPQAAMFETLDATVPHLPMDRPRYLMGVGKPGDIVGAVLRGIDMFDCVLPTRSGRNGQAFTRRWHPQPAQRGACGRRCPAGWRMRLPCLYPVQPRLPASCGKGERDYRLDAADLA